MNKKILVMTVAVLVLSISLTPFVFAKPWDPKPNNEKFQEFDVEGTFNYLDIYLAPIEYVPSFDRVNKALVAWEETMITYAITVDGDTYTLADFTYTGTGKYIFYEPVFTDPETKLDIGSYRALHAIIDYMYDFGDGDGGLDGTLTMRAITTANGEMHIFSKQGTGDFKNVNIQATASSSVVFPIVTIYHDGIVSGWPTPP